MQPATDSSDNVVEFRRPRVGQLEPHDVLLIVGKRGTGKSHAAKELAGAEQKRGRVLVFDYHDEYSRVGRRSDAVTLGPVRARCTMDELRAKPELLDDPRLSLAVVPRPAPDEAAADFVDLVELVLESGRLTFFCDELGAYEEHAYSSIDLLATQSRHSSVPVVLAAQRLVQIPKTARAQATQVLSFNQSNPDDLRELEKLAGPDFAAQVARLPRRQCLHWRDDAPIPPKGRKP